MTGDWLQMRSLRGRFNNPSILNLIFDMRGNALCLRDTRTLKDASFTARSPPPATPSRSTARTAPASRSVSERAPRRPPPTAARCSAPSAVSGNQTTKLTRLAMSRPAAQAAAPNTSHVAAAAMACGRPGSQVVSTEGRSRRWSGQKGAHVQFLNAGARFSWKSRPATVRATMPARMTKSPKHSSRCRSRGVSGEHRRECRDDRVAVDIACDAAWTAASRRARRRDKDCSGPASGPTRPISARYGRAQPFGQPVMRMVMSSSPRPTAPAPASSRVIRSGR